VNWGQDQRGFVVPFGVERGFTSSLSDLRKGFRRLVLLPALAAGKTPGCFGSPPLKWALESQSALFFVQSDRFHRFFIPLSSGF
jgi:hypothetical protein